MTIKNGFLSRTPQITLTKAVEKIISETTKEIDIPVLRLAAAQSLRKFAKSQYSELRRSLGGKLIVLTSLISLNDKSVNQVGKERARQVLISKGFDEANLYGVPLKKFSEDYFKKNVNHVLDRLIQQIPRDPDDVSGRNSLRNRAEMEVRYQGHQDNISELREAGHKLVIASAHADCSERCRKLQGRVYSLDGSSGVTDDGRRYVPLEEATDIFYTTKAGKVYKNGLLGFNCRHYLVPYRSGYKFPKPNPTEEARQYEITVKQREMERKVRYWRTEEMMAKGVNHDRYVKAREKVKDWNARYIEYSREHRRAYYPVRTKVM